MSSVRWKSARPFYVRLWYGDYELPVAFFVIGLAGLLGLAQWNWSPAFGGFESGSGLYWLSVGGLISDSARQPFTLVLLVVIVNCVWRSAYRFEGKAVWRGSARVAILAGAIAVAFVAHPGWQDAVKAAYRAVPAVTISWSDVALEDAVPGAASVGARPALEVRRRADDAPPSKAGPWVSYPQPAQ